MRVAPKTENSHLFVDDPILPALGISKLFRRDRHRRRIPNGRKSGKGPANLFGLEIDDEIDIERDSSVAMRVDSDPTNNDEWHFGIVQRADDSFEARDLHHGKLIRGEAVFQIIREAHRVIVQPLTDDPKEPPAYLLVNPPEPRRPRFSRYLMTTLLFASSLPTMRLKRSRTDCSPGKSPMSF
jgi:hypothetical protein